MKIKQCGICSGKELEGKSFGELGDYCNNCVERIKAHIKGLKMESAVNSTNGK